MSDVSPNMSTAEVVPDLQTGLRIIARLPLANPQLAESELCLLYTSRCV